MKWQAGSSLILICVLCTAAVAGTADGIDDVQLDATGDVRCRIKNDPVPQLESGVIQRGAPSLSGLHAKEMSTEFELSEWSPDRHTYRVCLYRQSYEVGVYQGSPANGGTLVSTIFPGSCADVYGTQLVVRHLCTQGDACAARQPLYRLCKKNGRVIERYPYYAWGWAVAEPHFLRKYAGRRPTNVVGPDGYVTFLPTTVPFNSMRIAALSAPRYYTICGDAPFYVTYDGNRLGPRRRCLEVNASSVEVEPERIGRSTLIRYFFTRDEGKSTRSSGGTQSPEQ
jgi:hypothetical protein